MIICTVADRNYLLKGLAMVQRLRELSMSRTVHWLCPDDESYGILIRICHKWNIIPIQASALCKMDPELEKARHNPPSNFGSAYSQWCWTLAPYFTNFCLNNYCKKGDEVFYIDSDIYMLDTAPLHTGIFKKSIYIHSHRNVMPQNYDPKTNTAGYYNVGVVGFIKNAIGCAASAWWKEVMLNPNNLYREQYGTCGDQKYLDLFPELFGRENIHVMDEDEPTIAHGAPWNAMHYKYYPYYYVTYDGRNDQELLCFWHFSHFTARFDAHAWASSYNGEWAPEKIHPMVNDLYERYYSVQRELLDEVRKIIPEFSHD